ncbi:hypothetical protein ABIC63_005934 [Pseudacidovorax sp. 1753]|uniref:hypothetical protein n=1 Tax=Pseudacidovorax sp. 1753 TaxID=3156419 RepID=UPI00339795DB
MATLFHATSAYLAPDSVIEPGNYGRILRLYPHDQTNVGNGWRLATELAFEEKRVRCFPNLPSRLRSCFAFPDREAAAAARGRMATLDVLYEVELADPDAPQHVGDFDLISRCYTAAQGDLFLQKVDDASDVYWSGRGLGVKELLTAGGLRVVRRISWPPTP